MVRLKGPAVRQHLAHVSPSSDKENQPVLVEYVELMLENNRGSPATGKQPCPVELREILRVIDASGGDPAAREGAVEELKRYRAENPKAPRARRLALNPA